MSNRFMKGAMILSLSMFVSRILGLLYVIPFQRLVGPTGLALYGYAYVPYNLLLTLSTLGIPIGVAKFISKYNAVKAYRTSRNVFRLGMVFMIFLGLVGFLIMWFGAPFFANVVMDGSDMHNTLDDVVLAIRMVSFAVIVVPPMSILRGFFQGNQDMAPTAISQLIEQLVRVTLIVVGSFIVVRILGGSAQMAVKISVFAAFVAGVSALFVLYRYWLRKKGDFDALLPLSRPHPKRSLTALFKELLSYALPFAILSLIATWFQLIDTVTFNSAMLRAGVDPTLTEEIFGIYIAALPKIIMIPVSFAIAFGQPLVPEITEKIQLGNSKAVHKTLGSAIMLTSFVTIPAVVGMALLSNPLYIMLFPHSEELNQIGGSMFGIGAFIGIFMAINAIIAAIMQGIDRQYKALIFLLVATVIKFIGNIILIPMFQVNGAIAATFLAYGICVLLNYLEIRKRTGIATRKILKQHISIFVFTALMAISVWLTMQVLSIFFDYTQSSLISAVYVLAATIVGVVVYAGLAIHFGLVRMLFGDKFSYSRIRARFRRSKS